MNQLDILYRAFLDYRKSTQEDEACVRMRHAIARASADRDKVESQRSVCTIEEDWVLAIEEGLPFIEKAIREERQFIRQHGEVIPIEKVRRVSKASVSHLARHGELITRLPEEGEDLIPDELYMVENLTNYAVYENRFLYMLLCYLRDFIDLRYNKIIELGNTYKANMNMAKTVTIGKRTITYNTQFTDDYRNDPLSNLSRETRDMIRRIEDLQNVVAMLLATPLMKEVAHVPMLKPPITRTNALKMDNALRKSLSLYDFVAAYTKDGYSVEVHRKTYSPLPEPMAEDFAETISLTSFLVYEYSNNIKGDLKEAYQKEEIRRRDEEAGLQRRQLDDLKERLAREEITPEEYILRLEERNRFLEGLHTELKQANQQIDLLTEENTELKRSVRELELKLQLREKEIEYLVIRHEAEMAELIERYEKQIAELIDSYEKKIAELIDSYEKKIADLIERYEKQIADLTERYEKQIAEMTARHEAEIAALIARYEAEIEERVRNCVTEYQAKIDALNEKYDTDMAAAEERRVNELNEAEERRAAEVAALEERYITDMAAAEERYNTDMAAAQERYDTDMAAAQERYDTDMAASEERYNTDMAAAQERYDTDMAAANERYDTDMAAANDRYDTDMAAAEERRQKDLAAAEEWHEGEVAKLNRRYDEDMSALNEKYEYTVKNHEIVLKEMTEDYEEQIHVLGDRARKAEGELEDMREKHIVQRAELRALRHLRGKDSNEEDFTSEERFKELVEELSTLDAFIGAHWKRAKRRIRHRYLWEEEEQDGEE